MNTRSFTIQDPLPSASSLELQIDRLSKSFRVKIRDPGLKGAFNALFRPRYRAVDGAPISDETARTAIAAATAKKAM